MSALTGSTATAVAHWSESTRRSPTDFTALMVHDAVGVRRRLPAMMKAGANTYQPRGKAPASPESDVSLYDLNTQLAPQLSGSGIDFLIGIATFCLATLHHLVEGLGDAV